MTTEEHLWAAMSGLHADMGHEAQPLNEKLTQALFSYRRWQRAKVTPLRALGLNVAIDRPRTAVVNHARDRMAGIHVVESDGGDTAA